MKRTLLTKDELRSNLAALQALIEDRPIEYWSEVLKQWCTCEDLDTDFVHRVKPPDEPATAAPPAPPAVSMNVEDY